jgi:uncharacterized repeat protein (TIGR01451 family)
MAVVAAALLAVFGLPYGAGNPEAFAHLYTNPANGNATHLHIDADITNGTRPCDPIDDEATVAVGAVHKIGVCLENYVPNSVNNFQLTVFSTGNPSAGTTFNLASEVADVAPALNDNPDANDGHDAAGKQIGNGWDCTGLGLKFPKGDDPATATKADAFIVCNAALASPDQNLSADPGLLATIEYTAIAPGDDVVDFGPIDATNTTNVQKPRPGNGAARCGTSVPADQIGCFGATIHKVADISVVKTVQAAPILAGGTVQFDLAVAANAPAPIAFLFDDLPNTLVYNDALTIAANGGVDYCDPAVVATPPVPGGDGAPVIVCGDILGAAGGGYVAAPEAMIVPPATIHIVADVPLGLAGKGGLNPVVVGPEDPNPANNYSAVQFAVQPADISITKVADKASYSEGDTITWTITATSNGPSPASSVVLSDVADANQQFQNCVVSTGDPCNFTATTATATLANPLAPTAVATMTITAKVVGSAGNKCVDDVTVTWADPLSHSAHAEVICLPPTVRMEKDIDTDATSIDNDANLFLCKDDPNTVGDECTWYGNGVRTLTIYELVSNPGNDPDGVGAYEFELKYDHNIFQQPVITDTGWLSNGGWRTVDCSMSIINENAIWWGCVSSGPTPPGGQKLAGVAAIITLTPQADMYLRLTPGQQNGVFSPILDENCELADILGDPLRLSNGQLAPGVLPGGQIAVCSDMGITVRILEGDLNIDCIVNVLDEQAIAFRYGATFGNLLYDPWYDLEPALKDYDIDIKDLQKVWGRQGSHCNINGVGTIPPQLPVPVPDP